jgi:hypothetical protein
MDIRDAQDSWMAGKRRWEEFIAEFDLRWSAPLILENLVMGLTQIPPEIMNNLPLETQQRIKQLIGGTNAR